MAEPRSWPACACAGLAACGLLLAAPASAEPPAERQAVLMHRLKHDCGSCHGMTLNGGLGPALRPDALAGRPDVELAQIILEGIPGTPMPPWAFEISREEAVWLVRRLKEGLDDAG